MFGPSSFSIVPLKSKDNTSLIKDPSKMLKRWQEHFRDLFYNPSVVDEAVIEGLPQLEMKHSMDNAPTMEEVDKAVTQIKNGKAPVHIPVELMKTDSVNVRQATFDFIMQNCGETIPQDWINGILMPLHKSKRER